MDWDDDRYNWKPNEDFEEVLKVLALKDMGYTHREIIEEVDAVGSTGTATNIVNRREEYETQMLDHGYTYPEVETKPAD